jgi:hypothetical protein
MEQSDKYTMYFNVLFELSNPGSPHHIELFKEELTYKR